MTDQPYICPECSRAFAWGRDDDSPIAVAACDETCAENAFWKLTGHMEAEHPQVGHLCPRRSDGAPASFAKRRDWWLKRQDEQRSCSYCGSMHPDDLFAAINAGAELVPTDKDYKLYVRNGDARQEEFYFQHFTAEQQLRFIDLYNKKRLKLAFPGHFYRLPFFAQAA
ncbi:hypothetical protein RPPS3_25640 [Rhodopseudomonas palustris]|nr:hypothetical protein RPPS3_25640 [Rhodopseudomonas palustris]